ncbi:MAG TPA: alkaline phosphatase [Desulfobacteria bacterium]|nr:alkaline phosphatase [Desulfobacteria bacterium]
MNRLKLTTMIIFLCFAMVSGIAGAQPEGSEKKEEAKPEKRVVRHIILITVDDLNDRKMAAVSTPNLDGLAAQGVRTSAVGVLPAGYPTFAASLLTGADPSIHGLVDLRDNVKTATLPDIAVKYGRAASYISQTGTIPVGMFDQKARLKVKNYEVATGEPRRLMTEAIKVFMQEKPFFLGIKMSLNENNYLGSKKAKTVKALDAVDTEIGKLLRALGSGSVINDSLIIVVGNSGNPSSKGVLSKDNSEFTAPVIMTGPGLKISVNVPPVRVTDIAPTAAVLSGMQMSPESNGFVLWNVLRPGNGFVETNLLIKRVKDLSEENVRSTVGNYRLMEEKRLVKAERERVESEKQKIQKTIEHKDLYIKSLNLKISLFKLAGVMALGLFGVGYVVEYFYLRKKFLMF